jgi:cell division septation protein DedD
MAKFAAEDWSRLPVEANHKASVSKANTSDAIYAVQAGSFSQRDNAITQQRVFSQAGYPVEIHEKKDARGTFYQVWVGEFNDRNQARDLAEKIQRQYKLSCHVVKRE